MTDWRFLLRVALKALAGLVVVNLGWALLQPLPMLGHLSAYNLLFPGRLRLPYGDHPERAYNVSLFQLEAMLASQAIAAPKPADEYRIILIGDSATWGWLLRPADTLAGQLNTLGVTAPAGKTARIYNLGYPVMSLTKDLLILQAAMAYQPDAIVWLVTLESFPYDKQLYPPLVQHNAAAVRDLITRYGLRLSPTDSALIQESVWDRTLFGQRRAVADWLRLQLYGVAWSATGIDQDYPATYELRQSDFEADDSFHNLPPPHLAETDLAFDILEAGARLAGSTPLLLVNEPTFQSTGKNSTIRYNFFYPRWAYDDYRMLLAAECNRQQWHCLDVWDLVPGSEYTNSAVHLTPRGSQLLAERVKPALESVILSK